MNQKQVGLSKWQIDAQQHGSGNIDAPSDSGKQCHGRRSHKWRMAPEPGLGSRSGRSHCSLHVALHSINSLRILQVVFWTCS
ncbi:unnamed protein product [Gadus morhua 'NCC']